MTQETTNNQSSIFIEIDKTIKAIGTDKLLDILKFSRKNKETISEAEIVESKNIIDVVCNEFELLDEDLYKGNRTTNRKYIFGICAFLMYQRLNLNNSDIAFLLKKEPNQISMYKKEITLLNESSRFDAKIIEKLKKITTILNTQKNGR